MTNNCFKDGREFEGLVRQIKSIYETIHHSKDRESMRTSLKHILDDIFPKFHGLAEKYTVPLQEVKEISNLYTCCIDEEFYQNYHNELKARREYLTVHG